MILCSKNALIKIYNIILDVQTTQMVSIYGTFVTILFPGVMLTLPMRWIQLKLTFSKNELRFVHHENGRVVRPTDMAKPAIDLKGLGDAHKNYASLISGKTVS